MVFEFYSVSTSFVFFYEISGLYFPPFWVYEVADIYFLTGQGQERDGEEQFFVD